MCTDDILFQNRLKETPSTSFLDIMFQRESVKGSTPGVPQAIFQQHQIFSSKMGMTGQLIYSFRLPHGLSVEKKKLSRPGDLPFVEVVLSLAMAFSIFCKCSLAGNKYWAKPDLK